MKKSWLIISLSNFLIAAVMGLTLRLSIVFPLPVTYTYLLHAHSHVALLGWLYMAAYCLLVHFFIPHEKQKRTYPRLFFLTQLTVMGMMVSFPFQGYALFSIIFTTLHIILSYCFAYRIWNDHNVAGPVRTLLKAALAFMVLSTLGAWALGIISSTAGKGHSLYNAAIQFFLHFQFNGWFTGAVLAIFLRLWLKDGMQASPKALALFYRLWAGSVICTLALPLSWYYDSYILPIVNLIGIALQFWGFALLLKIVRPFCSTAPSKGLLRLTAISFGFKVVIQLFTALPYFALAAHTIRTIAIGFIHLLMLGGITGLILAFIIKSGYLNTRQPLWKYGSSIFISGFAATEVILFGQGLCNLLSQPLLPAYPYILLMASLLLPIGLACIMGSLLRSHDPDKIFAGSDKYHIR